MLPPNPVEMVPALTSMPPEILLMIIRQLDMKDQINLSQVSKKCSDSVHDSWSEFTEMSSDFLNRFPQLRFHIQYFPKLKKVDSSIFIFEETNNPPMNREQYIKYFIKHAPSIDKFTHVNKDNSRYICEYYHTNPRISFEFDHPVDGEFIFTSCSEYGNSWIFRIYSLENFNYDTLNKCDIYIHLRFLDVEFLSQSHLNRLCSLCPNLVSLKEHNFENYIVPRAQTIRDLEKSLATKADHIFELEPIMKLTQLKTLSLTSILVYQTLLQLMSLIKSPNSKRFENLSLNLTNNEDRNIAFQIIREIFNCCINLRYLELSLDASWFGGIEPDIEKLKLLFPSQSFPQPLNLKVKKIENNRVVDSFVLKPVTYGIGVV